MVINHQFAHKVRSLRWRVWIINRCLRLAYLLVSILRIMPRVKVEGLDYVPRSGPVIIYANHPTRLDPLGLFSAMRNRNMAFLAKEEMFRYPVLGRLMRHMGMIPVVRGTDRARQASEMGLLVLRSGGVVAIFPEQGLTRAGEKVSVFAGGLAYMAQMVPEAVIVPAAIVYDDQSMQRGWRRWFAWYRVTVRFGPPLCEVEALPGNQKAARRHSFTLLARLTLAEMLVPAPERHTVAI